MPYRPFGCLDEQVRHSFHFCYSDKVERDWTRSNTAYRESSPNEHPHVGAENSLQINHSPVSLPGSSFLENIFLFRSGKIFAQISHSRTILITFTPELDHILKKNLNSLLSKFGWSHIQNLLSEGKVGQVHFAPVGRGRQFA